MLKISEELIKSISSATIYKRGMEYFMDGRVHIKSREENAITALVDGESIYNVRIDFENDKVRDSFCTCPYYQTMGTTCKHIVATLKKRQTELVVGENFKDENDRIAQSLCARFASDCFGKKTLRIVPVFNIITLDERKCMFSLELMCGFDELKKISSVDKFIESYINKTDYKLSKHTAINSSDYILQDSQERLMELICEAYENKTINSLYINSSPSTYIASYTAKRLIPILNESECIYELNSIPVDDLRILEENPDILVDINATDTEISLNISQSGTALFSDGSWFLYENCLYHTDEEWRTWFMPIYNSLMSESRTQIDFKGNSKIDFATYVYPKLRNKKGIVANGIDSMLVNEKPVFDVYLDSIRYNVSAVLRVKYGSIELKLPQDTPLGDKIVIRDLNAESELLSYFNVFDKTNETFTLNHDEKIFGFITEDLEKISEIANVYTSDSFDALYFQKDISVKTNVRYKKEIDLLEIDFETELSDDEILGILNAVSLKEKFYRLNDGSFVKFDDKNIKDYKVFESLGFSDKELKNRKKALSKYHLLYLSALSDAGNIVSDTAFDELVESVKKIKAKIPKEIKAVLRPYQVNGVNWLKQLSELGFGGILADDMGLGKTLEVIAFVMSEKPDFPALIVAPSALTYNWLSEIKKFAPNARAKILDGTKEERENSSKDISDYDFIITSYPLLRRDFNLYSDYEFSYMFIDESQNIKNPDTMNAKTVKKVKAKRKFALSGTPVENNLTELWSVFDFVMKGYLYSRKEFSKSFDRIKNVEENKENLEELRLKIKPFVLRRMKKDVLSELPEKIENTIYSEFLPEQKNMYEAFLALARNEVSAIIDDSKSSMKILTLLLRLRQICCHPSLFDNNYKKDSGKLLLLDEIISSAVSHGHRILIFSQFTSMLDIIGKRLSKNGYEYFMIDGKTSSYNRIEMSNRFNRGEKEIFLISLKAGGTGLNLTGADTVILYDPWWNPAVMEQAADRAYRIGQTKAVQVIKLAARGTIEEKILKLQEAKKDLAESVIRKNEKTISGLTKNEILDLFE